MAEEGRLGACVPGSSDQNISETRGLPESVYLLVRELAGSTSAQSDLDATHPREP